MRKGDRPIPENLLLFYKGIMFNVIPFSAPDQPDLTYNDTIAILEAFMLKTKLEGYHEWIAECHWNIGGRFLGDALFVRGNDLDV